MASTCDAAMRILADGRWLEWHGLPADCTLATLEAACGRSTVLDAETALGSERVACTRSSMNERPLTAWHRSQQVLLVEYEIPEPSVGAPAFDDADIHRFDVAWGSGILAGGEWVVPGRGLALIVVPSGRVVGCLGFAPTDIGHYAARLRPSRARRIMPRARHVHGRTRP